MVVLVLAGCGGDDEESGSAGELVVSAASSLTTAFEEIGGARFSFAGSDELAAQIRQGVPVDVFASANTKLPDALFEEGLVEEPVVFAGNKLVLAVPAGDAEVGSLDDLTGAGVKIAMGSEDVPVGAYTREVIDQLDGPRGRSSATCAPTSPTSRASSASSRRARSTPASSTSPTSRRRRGELRGDRAAGATSARWSSTASRSSRAPTTRRRRRRSSDALLEGDGRQALLDAGFSTP